MLAGVVVIVTSVSIGTLIVFNAHNSEDTQIRILNTQQKSSTLPPWNFVDFKEIADTDGKYLQPLFIASGSYFVICIHIFYRKQSICGYQIAQIWFASKNNARKKINSELVMVSVTLTKALGSVALMEGIALLC